MNTLSLNLSDILITNSMRLEMYSVFDSQRTYNLKSKMFLDETGSVNVARYDVVKYKKIDDLFEKQLGFFWRPQEVDVSRDAKDFKDLSEHEKHIFTSNLKRQILLDSINGRSPAMLIPIISIPELEHWVALWCLNEQIHSKSYTHIIRNVYPNPSIVFDEMLELQEIIDCANDITKYYDDLSHRICHWQLGDYNGMNKKKFLYELKKSLWLVMQCVNALEGVRFYVSFACSWNFAEQKKMEGNAKIIKLIARDENCHLAFTQQMLKWLPEDDDDFKKIEEETREQCIEIWKNVVEQEKEWADYLFKNGSMLGLNDSILKDYVDWISNKRMRAIGLPTLYQTGSNPLPWTQKWIGGKEVQVAPQETQITQYVIGNVEQDVSDDTFKDITL